MKRTRKLALIITLCLLAVLLVATLAGCGECSHDYGEYTVTKAATCTEAGTESRTCKKCGAVDERTIEATGHAYTREVAEERYLKSPATCTEAATYYKSCVCGEKGTDTFRSGASLGHMFGDPTWEWNHTHTEATASFPCTREGCERTETRTASADAISRTETAATCSAAGTVTYTATVTYGDRTYTDTVTLTVGDPLPHTPAADWDTDETSHRHLCTVCGTAYDEAAHDFAWVTDIEATEDHTGLTHEACTVCGYTRSEGTVVPMKPHTHVMTHHAPTAATCLTAGNSEYWFCETCYQYYTDEAGTTETTKAAVTLAALGHDLHTETTPATCLTAGSSATTCSRCDFSESKDIAALGHAWDHAASCTEGHACTREGCSVTEPALGHDYQLGSSTEADCTRDGEKVYVCSRCPASYAEKNGSAKGHHAEDAAFTLSDSSVGGTADLCRTDIYTAACDTCGETINKEVKITAHTLRKVLTTAATCQTAGTYTYTCECGYHYDESYTDPDAHAWDAGTETDGVTVYTCTHEGCAATKKTVSAKTEKNATVGSDTLKEIGEVELKNANISLDKSTLDALTGNVTLGADKLEGDARDTYLSGLSEETKARLGDNAVYDFSLSDENGTVTSFDGTVTVRIPYTLGDGEDPSCLYVYWIQDDGTLASTEAVYENGYAVFTTTHFSYYTVARLTVEERCRYHGHDYADYSLAAGCVTSGYELKICKKCGDVQRTFHKALGHEMVLDTEHTHEATCIAAGEVVYRCKNCDYTYSEISPALGHDWQETDRTAATCQAAGSVTYGCSRCDETYTVTIAQTAHEFESVVTPATCTTSGLTTYTCAHCGYRKTGNYTAALGHAYGLTVVAPTCTADGYTLHACSRCEDSYRTDIVPAAHKWNLDAPTCGTAKFCVICNTVAAPATGEHTMHDGVCTVCGAGCEHDFTVRTVPVTCTEDGYTEKTCKKCGVTEKTDIIPATGHTGDFLCTVCHAHLLPEDYFFRLMKSLLTEDFTLVVSDLTVTAETNLSGPREIRLAELRITLDENGKLYATAYIDMSIATNNWLPFATDAKVIAVIEGKTLYAIGENVSGDYRYDDNSREYLPDPSRAYVVMNLIDSLPENVSEIAGTVFDTVLPLVKKEILPAMIASLEENSAAAEDLCYAVANTFLSLTRTQTGYTLALDFDKLHALNNILATRTVAELADAIFGEGAWTALVDLAVSLPDMTVAEALNLLKSAGIDVVELLDMLDAAVKEGIFGNYGNLDTMLGFPLTEMLKNEQFLASKLGDLLLSAMGGSQPGEGEDAGMTLDQLKEIIASTLNTYGAKTIYAILEEIFSSSEPQPPDSDEPSIRPDDAEETEEPVVPGAQIAEMIDQMIEMLRSMVSLSVDTNAYGMVRRISLSATIPAGDGIVVSGELSIVCDYLSEIDYVAAVNEALAMAKRIDMNKLYQEIKPSFAGGATGTEEEEILSEFDDETLTFRYLEKSFRFKLQPITLSAGTAPTYAFSLWLENGLTFSVRDYQMLEIFSDCSDSIRADIIYPSATRMYGIEIYPIADGVADTEHPISFTECPEELRDFFTALLEVLHISPDEIGVAQNASSTTFHVSVDAKGTLTITESYGSTNHDFVLRESETVPAVGCTGVGEHHYYCSICGEHRVGYFCNGHGETEESYEFDGERDCEKGVTRLYRCKDCGEVVTAEHIYFHDTYQVELDLPEEYSHHKITLYTCPCGKRTDLSYEDMYQCGNDGQTAYFKCNRELCDLMLAMEHRDTQIDGDPCHIRRTSAYTVGTCKEGNEFAEVLFTASSSYEGYNHQMLNHVSLAAGATSCEDGVILESVCRNCGLTESDKIYYHLTGIREEIDLKEYGFTGSLALFGCACGSMLDRDIELLVQDSLTIDSIPDDTGRMYTVYTSQESGAHLAVSTKYEDGGNCTTVVIRTICFGFNPETFSSVNVRSEIVATLENHSFRATYELIEGAETCEDGIRGIMTCTNCGRIEKMNDIRYEHLPFEKETIDLSAYGCKCGGYLVYSDCACGKSGLNHNQNGLYNSSAWIHDEKHNCTGYWEYVSDDENEKLSVNRCPVDEPEVCGCTYYRLEEFVTDGCTIYCYYTYLFGYDEETGTAEKSIRFLHHVIVQHDEEALSSSEVRREDAGKPCTYYITYHRSCSDCGREWEETDCVESHSIEIVADEKNPCRFREVCSVCGTSSRSYVEHGDTFSNEEEPSCTQDGYRIISCSRCHRTVEEEYLTPTGHDWVKEDESDLYTCSVCGLESKTGVAGAVELEDFSYEDDICIGYWLRDRESDDQQGFALVFSLVIEGEEPVVLTVSDQLWSFDPDMRAIVFSRTDLVDIATEAGYEEGSYDLRVSFIPDDGPADMNMFSITLN